MSRALGFAGRYLYALGGFLYLLSFGLLRPHHRRLINVVCSHFGLRTRLEPLLPPIEPHALVDASEPVRLLEPHARDGNVSLEELYWIAHVVAACAPSRIFELGTFDGRTTLNLAANAGAQAEVYTLDLPERDDATLGLAPGEEIFVRAAAAGSRFRNTPWESCITQLRGDSARFDFSPWKGSVDVVFVDASHAYEYVRNDSRVALDLLRPEGGVVLWHDYGVWDGVTRTLDELRHEREFRGLRHLAGTSLAILATGTALPRLR